MNWTQKDAHHMESSCGRYTIAKVILDGIAFYEAWDISTKPAHMIGVSRDVDEAKGFPNKGSDDVQPSLF